MKLLNLLATGALLFFSQVAAAPVEQARDTASAADANSGSSEAAGKAPSTTSAADYGSPQCKNSAIFDLCTANNANAYCDGTGFHNNFMASCKGVCWCQ